VTDRWDALTVIRTKRDGDALTDDAIEWFIDAYTRGLVADEQAAALCMAVLFRGLDDRELHTWTTAMIDSGTRMDLSGVGRPTVDKHSTGGVGDKLSLPLCPLVASFGAAVPQLSGRALGHTGGTLDKMESIPGWSPWLDPPQVIDQLRRVGAVIAAASDELAPADRRLYALRDVTGTVESIALIASSIMSKKIAEGTGALVLDVKVGRGAFMRRLDDARRLAETMVGIGARAGVRTVALLTRMDRPLGRAVGNALEVAESVEVLDGGGPSDVRDLTVTLASEMLALVGIDADPAAALDDGRARATWDDLVRAQGGDPTAPLPRAAHRRTVDAPADGYVVDLDALPVGIAATRLGAGRARKEDLVSPGAGICILVGPGEPVSAGQPVLELHADEAGRFGPALAALEGALVVGPEPPPPPAPLVIDRIG
jgi:thymidine phosphorylase